jgi:hypothetical protein
MAGYLSKWLAGTYRRQYVRRGEFLNECQHLGEPVGRFVVVDWTRDGQPAGRRIFRPELESRWGRAEKGIA